MFDSDSTGGRDGVDDSGGAGDDEVVSTSLVAGASLVPANASTGTASEVVGVLGGVGSAGSLSESGCATTVTMDGGTVTTVVVTDVAGTDASDPGSV